MSTEEELKWMTKKYSWRYIPFRYQAMVAIIVSAFLYYNLFEWFLNFIESFLNLSRTQERWLEFFGSFAALAICGLVMRRAIKRDDANS